MVEMRKPIPVAEAIRISDGTCIHRYGTEMIPLEQTLWTNFGRTDYCKA